MGWIGVDLDGTLAEYKSGTGGEFIGKPIQPMLIRVLDWMNAGKEVKIFTARATEGPGRDEWLAPVRAWLIEHLGADKGGRIEITNVKDYAMIELWDDRAIQVEINTGRRVDGKP